MLDGALGTRTRALEVAQAPFRGGPVGEGNRFRIVGNDVGNAPIPICIASVNIASNLTST